MEVVQLYTYYLKSGAGRSKTTVEFSATGFLYDRSICIIDKDNKIVTGRDYPQLLNINSSINDNHLILSWNDIESFQFMLPGSVADTITIKLFRNTVVGYPFMKEANDLISNFLQGIFRFVYVGNSYRPLVDKRGGREGEKTGYADSSPVHLINLKTLEYLNSSLEESVTSRHFRPNIVVDGNEAFEEDSWALIEINGVRFRLQEQTQRCVFINIHPVTQEKNQKLQPLSTIASLRAKSAQRPTFGIGLVPNGNGIITRGDTIKIIETS